MSLSPGTRIGSYEITGTLGAGGMGEVYRATDTHLGREVAIKVLPDAFAHDADRLARFDREARTLAALSHPNIATIHGLEKSEAIQALVMELVDGPTLADRIAQGALPLDEALAIARQVADALEAAHEQGIVHRDLKPANVKVRADGTVKVLDFGLAKAMETAPAAAGTRSISPTITSPAMTAAGMLLGTAAYMSPEQAKGRAADKRSDLWAFGCLLYEMLTGVRAFPGDDFSEVFASVIKTEPELTALPADLPPSIRTLLKRCLEKDPRRRISDIAAARFVLADHAALSLPASRQSVADGRPRRRGVLIASLAAAVVAAIALAVPAVRHLVETPPPEMRMEINTPSTPAPFEFALSPDGRYIVFVASGGGPRRLWLRALDSTKATPLMGTDGAAMPFWSADSKSVGFFTSTALYRIDVPVGAPQAVFPIAVARGGTWNAEGTILFGPNVGPLSRIPASGGSPIAVTRVIAQQFGHRFPFFLPDGRHFLFYATGSIDVAGLYLGSLDDQEQKRLTASDGGGVYLPPDYVVFPRQGTLVMQRLELARGELMGDPIVLGDSVGFDSTASETALAVSTTGYVAFRSGGASRAQLTWFSRTGATGPASEPDATGQRYTALSPDEKKVAVNRTVQGNQDIYVVDLVRGGATRFTFDASNDSIPVWDSHGSRIAFASNRSGVNSVYVGPANQPGAEQLLLKSPNVVVPQGFSNDGKYLLYYEVDPKTGRDLKAAELFGNDQKTHIVANTRFQESMAEFSPDGRWIAYQTDESGRSEIVVKPFPVSGGQWQVSTEGGAAPRWRADSKELYFIAPDGSMMATDVSASGTSLEPKTPVKLFPTSIVGGGTVATNRPDYAVSRDGRFLINLLLENAPGPITMILNVKR